jgi:3D (Asp-Asp-Asp) domain-containing protein
MKSKQGIFQFIASFMVCLLVTGCGQGSGYRLRDQASEDPEYTDFTDLPDPSATSVADTSTNDNSKGNTKTPTGIGIGTAYYLPIFGDQNKCGASGFAYIKDKKDRIYATICKAQVQDCRMQGSCYYVADGHSTLFSFDEDVTFSVPGQEKKVKQPRFMVNPKASQCPQGVTRGGICLDPYRSVAADLKIYKLGDVIFVPKLQGQKLPNGETHDGYLIVRDAGGAIKGVDRFDFYIGFDDYHGHLFSKLKLTAKQDGPFQYSKASEDIAAKIRAARNYPDAPTSVRDLAVNYVLKATPQLVEQANVDNEYAMKK